MSALSAAQIADRLQNSFDLLSHGKRTALPRHQALRATIDWSYALLTDAEQRLFQRLAVFAGGFDLQAAENEMDDVTSENLANLQATAKKFVADYSGELDAICAELKQGRGSDMPGIGR